MMRFIAAFLTLIFTSFSFAFNFSSAFDSEPEFLPVDQAFSLSVNSDASGQVWATWDIADGYYLYRHQLKASSETEPSLSFTALPDGEMKQDPYFGEVEVYHQQLKLPLNVANTNLPQQIDFTLRYQGCAEKGLCYPPQTVPMSAEFITVSQSQPVAENALGDTATTAFKPSEAQQVSTLISQASFSKMLVVMFGLGLLLSLTPCVLPMIPIVSAIVVGSKAKGWSGLYLSAIYVLGMALTYAAIGALAGWFGTQLNLQAALQDPLILLLSAVLFVTLALAMFGVYELRLPSALQTRLDHLSNRSQNSRSKILGIFLAGVFATLVVSPCVSAPLAGVVLYISSTSDPLYGAAALFSMGLGMGLPLLLVGTLGSKVLPKNGAWLEDIKKLMGFAMLGLAIWLANRWLAEGWHLLLWGLLSLALASYFLHRALTGDSHPVRWLLALSAIIVGFIEIIGAASGSHTPLSPLNQLNLNQAAQHSNVEVPYYRTIGSLAELQQIQSQSSLPVVVDLYADWCISCKVTEEEVFKHPDVLPLLQQITFVQVDVTDNNSQNQAFLQQFDLFGPPAMLFFNRQDELLDHYSLVGEPTKDEVEARLQALLSNKMQ
ncbi:Thiol:disulfide interchange protein DsbD precursor [Marinomonas aquimarina]|uniref:Thiol:disulfide interchange protein DsbD n=1 Tax=Marinomonas aquimarina TaxID=295068 RepID=A0A1A8T608_9GAMM|nr:protein-disulfide reductase DsbD [Marinomonas aquimarina]SBS26467.1 Thiol:disulfide interchange protein DsbD precursor [Marinomonas aquimarina]